MIRRIVIGLLLITGFGAAVIAQEAPAKPAGSQGQSEANSGGRPTGAKDTGRAQKQTKVSGRKSSSSLGILDRISKELELTPDQQKKYDDLAAKQREAMDAAKPTGEEQQRIAKEMAQARKAGDLARAAELRDQLIGNPDGKAVDNFLDEVEPMLTKEQAAKLPQIREDYAAQRGTAAGDPIAKAKSLRSELGLDADQAKQFNKLLEQMESDIQSSKDTNTDELIDELRKAVEAGDEDSIRSVGTQITDSQQAGTKSLAKFYDAVDGILTDEQRDKLDTFRSQHGDRPESLKGVRDPREIFRLARRLKLNDDQRQQMRALEEEYGKKTREKRGDRDGMAELSKQAADDVRKILNENQVVKFDRMIGAKGEAKDTAGAHRERDPNQAGKRGGGKRGQKPQAPETPENEKP